MAQRAIIEVVARFKDEASKGMKETAKNADNTKSKLDAVAGAAAKLGKMNPKLKLDADDRASSKITKAMDKARAFASKTYSVAVQLKDKITAPLQRIKDSLFSIKSLAVAVGGVLAANKLITSPVAVADAYTSTKIGFSTLLGDERGQQMMDEMDAFAKKTPFKTSNVIDNAQKMMAYGWDAERILTDMETIGNAAAATGKMDQGLESIVYALSEIRSKGKLSTQELNQLASAGIKAKAYLAEGLGYGTSDEGMMKLAADLEDGAIGAQQAIDLILEGMKEFDGMMDRTANETVAGLKAQLEDVFEINIQRRWGQGLQDGMKRGLGSIVSLLDKGEEGLTKFGDALYELGYTVSNWAADKLENSINRLMEVMDSEEFKNASLGEKIGIVWDEVIAKPLSAWWEGGGKETVTSKAKEIGETLGSGIISGLSLAWEAMPWWGKLLVGAKVAGSAASTATSIGTFLGSTGTAMVGGSGLLGGLSSAGYALTGGAAGSTLAGGTAALIGGAGILGGIGGLLGIGSAFNSFDKGDYWGGGTKLGMVGTGAAAGAAIGSVIPGLGTAVGGLIGAGVGGLGAIFSGEKVGQMLSDLTNSVGEFFNELPGKWDELWDSVGTFFSEKVPWALGYATGKVAAFFTTTLPEKWDELWNSLGTFFTETIPTWADETWNNKIVPFFKEDIPSFFDSLWDSVCSLVTEGIPSIADTIWGGISGFFTETVPGWFSSVWENLKGGFSAGYGGAGASVKNNAAGGIIGGRTLSWLGEEGPEAVIPLGSKHRSRAIGLFQQAGEALGMGGGGTSVDVGGVHIHISGSGNVAADIENQKEEIAQQVAAIFNRVMAAQFENMPARGGA